jgi:hypothetical protein
MIPRVVGDISKRPGTTLGGVWDAIPITGAYPMLHELDASEYPSSPSEPTVNDGVTTVANATELYSKLTADKNGSYILTADIDMTAVVWTPIADFRGTLDGDGYTISNLTSTDGLIKELILTPKIKDLNLDNFTITSTSSNEAGALAGKARYLGQSSGTCIIKNVHVTNSTITSATGGTGGLIGEVSSESGSDVSPFKAWNCSVTDTDVTSSGTTGGMFGYIDESDNDGPSDPANYPDNLGRVEIVGCHVYGGTVSGGPGIGIGVGGFIGNIQGRNVVLHRITDFPGQPDPVIGSGTWGNTTTEVMWTPGLEATFLHTNDWAGTLEFEISTDGVVWTNALTLTHATAYAEYASFRTTDNDPVFSTSIAPVWVRMVYNITSGQINNCRIGFYSPLYSSMYYNCSTSADVTYGTEMIFENYGGFAGLTEDAIMVNCSSTGDLDLTGTSRWSLNNIGGFAGFCDDLYAFNCFSTTNITNTLASSVDRVGGFIGKSDMDAWLSRCYCTGNIVIDASSDLSACGGFLGFLASNQLLQTRVERCWTTSDFTLTGSYGHVQYGGFSGYAAYEHLIGNEPAISNCYTWGSILMTPVQNSANSYGVGGFLGYVDGSGTGLPLAEDWLIENCYSAQTNVRTGSGLTDQIGYASGISGGFLGQDHNQTAFDLTTTNCYFDQETAGFTDDESTADPQLTCEMWTKSIYEAAGWSFSTVDQVKGSINDIWYMPADYSCSNTSSGGTPTAARLIPFVFSTDDSYILAFDDATVGFLRTESGVSGRIQE